MRKRLIIYLTLLVSGISSCTRPPDMKQSENEWPVIKSYDQEHLYQIAMPLGGIGTGTVSLGGRGELRDWEIMNRPAKGFYGTDNQMNAPFFAIYTKEPGKKARTKALMGPLYDWEYQHMEGRSVPLHGLPRFTRASFSAAYPFGQVFLSDDSLPVDITIKGFNPLIPSNMYLSGLPIAVLYYAVKNRSEKDLIVSVCGTMRNFIGADGSKVRKNWKGELVPYGSDNNRNEYRDNGNLKGIFMSSNGVDKNDPAWGTMALSVLSEKRVTFRTGAVRDEWNNAIQDFWEDFSTDGTLTEKAFPDEDQPMAALAVCDTIKPGGTRQFKFLLSWHFPNRMDWWGKEKVGNFYTTNFYDAWGVAYDLAPYLKSLEKQTLLFVKTLMNTGLPQPVLESALFNLSTLRSQTVFVTPDSKMFGWEGCMNDVGSCWGSCTHVWNYEQATPFLFGSLSKSMRETEFGSATDTNGLMSFRISLPLEKARNMKVAAADGQMGSIMRFYRDWQLSGDSLFLENYWPKVKSALSFSWVKGGWDANRDGVMEGIQHNTMDVEYYGPNPQMELWYLGALRACKEMAIASGDTAFALLTGTLFKRGSEWTDSVLFNGDYYEQKIILADSLGDINSNLKAGMGSNNLKKPDYQLGKACLVDQLVGQYMSHICDLGYLVKPENVKTTLSSINRYNHVESQQDRFNNMRSFALGNEKGLVMASWPRGKHEVPFPYFSEIMSGFEYTAAAAMLFEGMNDKGIKIIKEVRDRYDGKKRNPFNEAECGYHYSRAMTSWASIIALTGFHYSAVSGRFAINSENGSKFWSTGYAWGLVEISGKGQVKDVKIHVYDGQISLGEFVLNGFGKRVLSEGKHLIIKSGELKGFSVIAEL
ncbi:MAG: GH116 family glycosyl-hydrolase [Bacteroidales bacterium]